MKDKIRRHLELFLDDNCQAWVLKGDGTYERQKPGKEERISAQDIFLEHLTAQT
jgi:polyphosphate kinase